jgi:hypothetical protein
VRGVCDGALLADTGNRNASRDTGDDRERLMRDRELLFYVPGLGDDRAEEALLRSVEGRVSRENVTAYRSFDRFRSRLLLPSESKNVVVVVPASEDDLFRILEISDLLRDSAVVVALTDAMSHTAYLAFRLRPRFLGSLDGDREDIAAVVENLATAA